MSISWTQILLAVTERPTLAARPFPHRGANPRRYLSRVQTRDAALWFFIGESQVEHVLAILGRLSLAM